MKKIVPILVLLLLLVSCSTPLKVTEVKYVTPTINLEKAITVLEASRPSDVPEFPDPLPEGAGELDTLLYLGNVISAYKTSLEAWQFYSEAQHEVLLTLQEELK